MTVKQLPGQVREFANYLDGLLARLDQGGGWCGVFWQRDPDGMQACVDGREVPPWDVVEALLQDLAAGYGPDAARAEAEHARALHAAALTAYDARPGGRDALGDRLDVMLREQRYAAERQAELGRLLAVATSPEEADAIRLDLAWARDDHERATARCAELRARKEELERLDASGQAAAIRRGRGDEGSAVFRVEGVEGGASERAAGPSGARGAPHEGDGWGPAVPQQRAAQGRWDAPHAGAPAGAQSRAAGRRFEATGDGAAASGAGRFDVTGPGAGASGAGHPAPGSDAFGPGVGHPAPGPDAYGPGAGQTTPATPWSHADSTHPTPQSAAPTPQPPAPTPPPAAPAPQPAPPAPKQRKRRRGSARFAGMAEEEVAPVAVPPAVVPVLPEPAAGSGRTPRGARFAGADAVEQPEPQAVPLDGADRQEIAGAVARLVRLRTEGRSGEAHALLAEIAYSAAARYPLLAVEMQHAGLGADWATLLWEAASLPADRLVAAADALVAGGRGADAEQILRQGVVRPPEEIGRAVLGLAQEGRRREIRALLDAYVRVRTPEEAARSAAADPQTLVPLLLEAARSVSEQRHWDLVHALRVAGFTT
ncbi:hypothetical protein AB0I00_02655 [Streptomyces sp. NPDC050803]|uniref:hypothetical protein n=1 Tax=unclassified Streptomyces TaxID=2593676 RepID=UPI003412B977